jgi:hypothetical protein
MRRAFLSLPYFQTLLFADLAILIWRVLISGWPVITPSRPVIQYSDDLANVFIEDWQSPRIFNHPD